MGLAIQIKNETKIKIGDDIVLEFSSVQNRQRKVVITAPKEKLIYRITEDEKLSIEGTKSWTN